MTLTAKPGSGVGARPCAKALLEVARAATAIAATINSPRMAPPKVPNPTLGNTGKRRWDTQTNMFLSSGTDALAADDDVEAIDRRGVAPRSAEHAVPAPVAGEDDVVAGTRGDAVGARP